MLLLCGKRTDLEVNFAWYVMKIVMISECSRVSLLCIKCYRHNSLFSPFKLLLVVASLSQLHVVIYLLLTYSTRLLFNVQWSPKGCQVDFGQAESLYMLRGYTLCWYTCYCFCLYDVPFFFSSSISSGWFLLVKVQSQVDILHSIFQQI